MFGKKKMYKKGLADAMRAYEEFGKKQEAALEHMREEVRSGNKKLEDALTSLGDDLNGIYKYLNSKEKDVLYHLSTPMDIKELEEKEQRLLLAVLYQLAEDEGDTLTDDQRSYIRSVQRYMGITNPQTFADFSSIENIDSIDIQKTFLRVALEFFYLQDGDELSDAQEEFFDYFSVNKKQATVIENEVSRLFNAVGAQGMAEKYGYVPETGPAITVQEEQTSCGINNLLKLSNIDIENNSEITEDFADDIVKLFPRNEYFETENYLITDCSMGYFYRIDKRTHEIVKVTERKGEKGFPRLDTFLSYHADDGGSFAVYRDTLYYIGSYPDGNGIYKFDFDTLEITQKIISGYCNQISISGDSLVFFQNSYRGCLCSYNIVNKKITILVENITCRDSCAVLAVPNGVFFCYDVPCVYNPPYYCTAVSFYDYSQQKEILLFKANRSIKHILFADDQKIFIGYSESKSFRRFIYCDMIQYAHVQKEASIDVKSTFDVWYPSVDIQVCERIYGYPDYLLYVANNGIVKGVNYITGEITELAANAINGADFTKKVGPAKLFRIGKWIYFEEEASSKKDLKDMYLKYTRSIYKVSLGQPNRIAMLQTYEDAISDTEHTEREKRMQEIKVVNLKAN